MILRYFPHFPLVYTVLYALLPRAVSVPLMTLWTAAFGILEFIRIRRPEVNAHFLAAWKDFYAPSEVLTPSRFFWAALGCWLTILVFNGSKIVLMALGLLALGREAAVLVGEKWGATPWPNQPQRTVEGSVGFILVCTFWGLFIVHLRWPVAFLGSVAGAWIDGRRWRWPNAVVLPLLGGFILSALNLFLGGR